VSRELAEIYAKSWQTSVFFRYFLLTEERRIYIFGNLVYRASPKKVNTFPFTGGAVGISLLKMFDILLQNGRIRYL